MMNKNKREEYIVSSNTLNKLSDFIESCLNLLEIDFLVDDSKGEINYIDKKTILILYSQILKSLEGMI